MTYSELAKMQSTFSSFTSLEVPDFDSLYQRLRVRYEGSEKERLLLARRRQGKGRGEGPTPHPRAERFSKQLSKERVVVEHTISRMKFRMSSGTGSSATT